MVQATVPLRDPLDETALDDVSSRLARIFDVTGLGNSADGVVASVADDVSAEQLHETLTQIMRVSRRARPERVFSNDAADWDGEDAQPALEARGDVQRLGPGLFAFRGDFLAVRSALDGVIHRMARRLDATELAYPPLWPIAVLKDIDYFHDFPQLTMLAAGVGPDFAARSRFSETFRKTSGSSAIACTAESGVAPAVNTLAPTVCDCCYWLLRRRNDVSDETYTVHGHVFRNESSPTGALDRLSAYTMREIVLVGSETFVLGRHQLLLEEMKQLLRTLGLRAEIVSADDPFFSNSLHKTMLQTLAHTKYELRVALFDDRDSAVGSLNLHGDFFSRNYGYTMSDGAPSFSACLGIGFERLAYALFCRYGSEPARWPGAVRELLRLERSRAE